MVESATPEQRTTGRITFSFGRNWRSFSRTVSANTVAEATKDIVDWLGEDGIRGKTVVDIGSGSGIHSAALHRLGAAALLSLDVDPDSVACTRAFWIKAGKPQNWSVRRASVLDINELPDFGSFDLVYSWGVLHHTGDMWMAIENASKLAKPKGSRLWISIYAKGDNYASDLETKQRFNQSSWWSKQYVIWRFLYRRWRNERRNGRSLGQWFWHRRGMNAYHDAIDWFGGLPYEVASVDEVTRFLGELGWRVERVQPSVEGGCSNYLFRR